MIGSTVCTFEFTVMTLDHGRSCQWPLTLSQTVTVVQRLKAMNHGRSMVMPLIQKTLQEARQLCRFKVLVVLVKIWKARNKVTHVLAELAIRFSESCVFFSNFLECVEALICKDIITGALRRPPIREHGQLFEKLQNNLLHHIWKRCAYAAACRY